MKKFLLILLTILLLAGCKKNDVNTLKEDNNELANYENLLDALNKRLHIKSYETKGDYYVITMSNNLKLMVSTTSSFIEIGENGNWWINGVDSQHSAKVDKALEINIGTNSNWWINGDDTGILAKEHAEKDATEILSIALIDGIMTFVFVDGRTISIETTAPEVTLAIPSDGFVIDKMKWIRIQPQVKNISGIVCKWLFDGTEIADTKDLLYVFAKAGSYSFEFKAKNSVAETSKTITITVNDTDYQNKITQVFEYLPAPGQYINTLPIATASDTDETMRKAAEDKLKKGAMICLGGFGGSVTFGFDHTIINKEGNDFVVLGNAFDNWSEPGIIAVSYDANGNGLPDDEWFEIAGSQHNKPSTIKNYEITYYKPKLEPTDPNEPNYIRWTDNQGQTGYYAKNNFHTQTYYPLWKGDSYTLKGTFLEANVYDQSGSGTYWVNPPYDWGYADNWLNTEAKAQINIDWAVDKNGKPANLKGIDFVKVYTGNRAEGGWLGEISTEVSGFNDLNL